MSYYIKKGIQNLIITIFFITIQGVIYSLLNFKLAKLNFFHIISEFLIFVFLMFFEKEYEYKSHLFWEELKSLLKVHLVFFMILIVFRLNYYEINIKNIFIDSIEILLFFISNILLSRVIRNIFYLFLKKNLLVIGTGELAKKLTDIIDQNSFTMYNLVGYVDYDNDEMRMVEKEKIITKLSELKKNKTRNIDEILIAIKNLSETELIEIIEKIEGKVKKIKYVPEINGTFTFNSKVEDYDGMMLITAGQYITSFKRKVIKRMFDIILGTIGFLIYGVLYLTIGRQIKKADGGSALFKHNRIGKNLQSFPMYKFRSMYIDAEERLEKMLSENEEVRNEFYTNFKLKDDPRITKVGKFIRKTSLDEFPQFINVIKGDMSIVGPRPVVQKEVDMYYGSEIGEKVFTVKPGITGMWQAHGRSDIEDYDERIALDLYYIRKWSLWLDIIILIKTIKNVLRRKGAY